MPYATWEDVQAGWRPLTADEQARATDLLEEAAVEINAIAPLADPPTVGELEARQVVSKRMVRRAMSVAVDALGVGSIQQGAGPYQETRNFTNPAGDLYLTKADRRLLGVGRQVAGMVDLAPDPGRSATPAGWV
jgi:hypothetical protein